MAISATTNLNVRLGGNDNNGGGFNASGGSPGTNYSLQDAAQVFIDGTTISAVVHSTTTQIVITGYTVAATDNRNLFQITGGTATAGTYEITAVDTVNNRWTLDRSAGTAAQTVVGRMGGARATVGSATGSMVGGNKVNVKKGVSAYTPSASITMVAGASGTAPSILEGYETTPGDLSANRPVIQATGAIANAIVDTTATFIIIRNIEFDCNAKSVRGIRCTGQHTLARFLKITASSLTALECGSQSVVCHNEVVGGSGSGIAGQFVFENYIHDRTGPPLFHSVPGSEYHDNVCANCTGATTDGLATSGIIVVRNNTFYNIGRHGISVIGSSALVMIENNLMDTCGGWGIASSATQPNVVVANNAFRSCTSGNYDSTQITATGSVSLTASAFVNAASNDFRYNSTPGGGAAVSGAAYNILPGLSAANGRSIGAYQSQSGVKIPVDFAGGWR